MPYGKEISLSDARARPKSWRWSGCSDYVGDELDEAIMVSPGQVLQAWRPQRKPLADRLALDLEEQIQEWGYDDTPWYALSTFSGGEPDGSQLLDSPTFGPALRQLLQDELDRFTVMAYEEAGEWFRVPEE